MSSFKRAAGAVVSRQRIQVPTISSIQIQNRTFASDSKNDDSKKLPFGLEKILGEPDNLIPTDLERKIDLRLTSINSNDLNETKEKNMEGYNEQ